jgi:hypothetical protein
MRKLLLLFFIFITLVSCSGFSEAGKVLRNEKTKTTDEFLVKKKDPLELPPNYDKLPLPKSERNKKKVSNDEINKILKIPKDDSNKKKPSSVEEAILDKIK